MPISARQEPPTPSLASAISERGGLLENAFRGPSWGVWRSVLKAAAGEAMSAQEIDAFRQVAGREPPGRRVKELWCDSRPHHHRRGAGRGGVLRRRAWLREARFVRECPFPWHVMSYANAAGVASRGCDSQAVRGGAHGVPTRAVAAGRPRPGISLWF